MLQIENRSPFQPSIALFPNEQGIDTLYIAIKATFALRRVVAVADEQLPARLTDEYWQTPESSSLRYAADVQLAKPSTDVALISQAWAPRDQRVAQIDVRLSVAEKTKTLRVFGNRTWKNGAVSAPEPFERMPIVYEYAFGGVVPEADEQGVQASEQRNPVGRGLRGKQSDAQLENRPLPNIEDPSCLVEQVGDAAVPAGFGFIAPHWQSRRQYAGTYDEQWQARRSPYLPADFNPRFFNTAHPDLIFDRYLTGGEPVELDNLSGRGPLRFHLPRCQLNTDVIIAGRNQAAPVHLDTVLIEPEADRLCMVWRGQVPCDKKALKVERVVVELMQMQLNGEVS